MSICRIARGRRIYETGEFPADCLVSRSAKAAPIRPPVCLVISSGKIRLRSTATVKPRCEAGAEAPQTRKAAFITFVFYRQFLKKDYVSEPKPLRADDGDAVALKPSKPGVIITIAREHGSSGKQIGKLAAQKLGIPFYYKEMVALAAHESGLDREFISDIHKNAPDAMRDLYLSSQVVQRAIAAQDRIIRRIADNGSCVIVGRAADYVLREHKNVVRVFVHAPLDYRIRRVMEVYGDTLREAKRNIRHSDKARASYYRHISGRRWGDAENYELTVDSSAGLEETAAIIVAYARAAAGEK